MVVSDVSPLVVAVVAGVVVFVSVVVVSSAGLLQPTKDAPRTAMARTASVFLVFMVLEPELALIEPRTDVGVGQGVYGSTLPKTLEKVYGRRFAVF